MRTAAKRNAAKGLTRAHSTPAMPLAVRLPKLWMAASSPNAEPLRLVGGGLATALCSAVSTNPMTGGGEPDSEGGERGSGETEDQVGARPGHEPRGEYGTITPPVGRLP